MMTTAPQPPPAPPAPALRVAVELTLSGDLRYLSHHDELRMLTRALIRARWPVAYSGGFNPLPRLVVPLPRSVGIAAATQLVLVDLYESRPTDRLHAALAAVLPAGCTVRRVIGPVSRTVPQARQVTYELDLDPADAAVVRARLPDFPGDAPLPVVRDQRPGRRPQTVDIQPYIEHIELNGHTLVLRLRVAAQRSARPAEILTKLGLAADAHQHRVRRGEIQWDLQFAAPDPGPANNERNALGKESSIVKEKDQ